MAPVSLLTGLKDLEDRVEFLERALPEEQVERTEYNRDKKELDDKIDTKLGGMHRRLSKVELTADHVGTYEDFKAEIERFQTSLGNISQRLAAVEQTLGIDQEESVLYPAKPQTPTISAPPGGNPNHSMDSWWQEEQRARMRADRGG